MNVELVVHIIVTVVVVINAIAISSTAYALMKGTHERQNILFLLQKLTLPYLHVSPIDKETVQDITKDSRIDGLIIPTEYSDEEISKSFHRIFLPQPPYISDREIKRVSSD